MEKVLFSLTQVPKIRVVVVNLSQYKEQWIQYFLEGLKLRDLKVTRVELNGPDAKDFIKNQITNSSTDLVSRQCILDSSGKIITYFQMEEQTSGDIHCYLDEAYVSKFIERVEKFHISEDFEIIETEKIFYPYFGTKFNHLKSFWYCGQDLYLSDSKLECTHEIFVEKFRLINGFYNEDKFFNDSRLLDFCYDRNKGCFLGAEVVSKLDQGRGSAYYPAYLEGEVSGENLKFETKTIARNVDQNFYLLLRDYRVSGLELDGGLRVQLFPIIAEGNQGFIEEMYNTALELYSQSDKAIESKKLLETCIKLNPKFEDAYEMLGVILGREEKYKEAIKQMEALEKLNPSSIMAKTNLSVYHMKIGDIETAEDYKGQATMLSFEKAGADFDLKKQEQEQLEDLKRRKSIFQQILEIDDEDETANLGIAEIFIELDEIKEATPYLEKIKRINPKIAQTYFLLGKCTKGNAAKENLTQAISLYASQGKFNKVQECQKYLKLLS